MGYLHINLTNESRVIEPFKGIGIADPNVWVCFFCEKAVAPDTSKRNKKVMIRILFTTIGSTTDVPLIIRKLIFEVQSIGQNF